MRVDSLARALGPLLLSCSIVACRGGISAQPKTTQVNCSGEKGGPRYTRPCEDAPEATAANFKLKLDYLEQVSAEIGLQKDQLIQLDAQTVRMSYWLRELCSSWNACIISSDEYLRRQGELIALESSLDKLVKKADEVKNAKDAKTKGRGAQADVDRLARQLQGQIAAFSDSITAFASRFTSAK